MDEDMETETKAMRRQLQRDRAETQLSQDAGLANPGQCATVCNQSQSCAREKPTQWTAPASRSITPLPAQTCTLGQMLFVLSSSACLPLSLNGVGWELEGDKNVAMGARKEKEQLIVFMAQICAQSGGTPAGLGFRR